MTKFLPILTTVLSIAQIFANPDSSKTIADEGLTPTGVSIRLLIDPKEGPGRPVVVLNNNTEKAIRYFIVRNQGWKVKVFNLEGKLLGTGGYEIATSGSFNDETVLPGQSIRAILDIRWGILENQNIPDICRVEVETPSFFAPNKDLSAKLSAHLKMSGDQAKPK